MAKAVGRPTKYDPEKGPKIAYNFTLLGATDDDLARHFEVSVDTITEWKKVHPEFSASIKEGKDEADSNVGRRLYERAMGFEHDSEEIKVVGGKVERVKVRKIYPPDTVAAIFWLKNRQKLNWRDKHEVDNSGEIVHKWEDATDDELDRAIKARQDRLSPTDS